MVKTHCAPCAGPQALANALRIGGAGRWDWGFLGLCRAWWRANIPVAAGVTLITNPFTIGFWLWLAYQAGSLVLDAPPPIRPGQGAGMLDYLTALGGPAILGMGIFAVGGGLAAYALVKIGWYAQLWLKQRRRLSRREPPLD